MTRVLLTGCTALVLGGLAGPAMAADSELKPGTYSMDPSHSYATFAIEHMGLSTMRGRIDITDGKIQIDPDAKHSHIEATLSPASVDTGHQLRDKHLRDNEGFFDVEKYPKMHFDSTSIRFDGDDEDEATVKGNLTLHGVTKPVTLEVEDIACRVNPMEKSKYTCGFSAETTIKRSDFGMDAYSKLVGDEVALALEIEANKPVGKGG